MIGLLGSGFFGGAIFDQFESLHQPFAAHIADERMLLLQLFEPCAEMGANCVCVDAQMFFFDDFDRGARGDAGDGIAAKSGDREAAVGGGEFARRNGGPDGHAVTHPFGARDDVGDHFPVLDAEPMLAGASEAGLHFVRDEEAAVFFHRVEDDLEVFGRRGDESADALNGFCDEGGDVAAGTGLDEIFDVIRARHAAVGILQAEGAAVAIRTDGVSHAHTDNAAGAPGSLRRHGLGESRSAGIAVPQRDDIE